MLVVRCYQCGHSTWNASGVVPPASLHSMPQEPASVLVVEEMVLVSWCDAWCSCRVVRLWVGELVSNLVQVDHMVC